MEQTITRNAQSDGSFIVHRIKNGEVQVLKETFVDSGEIVSLDTEMITVQTIIITRRIGEKITF